MSFGFDVRASDETKMAKSTENGKIGVERCKIHDDVKTIVRDDKKTKSTAEPTARVETK